MPENVAGAGSGIGFISQRAAPAVRSAGRPLAEGLHSAEGVKNAFEALLLGQLLKPLEESLSRSGLFPDGAAGDIYNHFWQSHMSSLLAESVDLIPGWDPNAKLTDQPAASSSPIQNDEQPIALPQSRSQTGTPLVDESKNEIRDLSGSDRRILPKESPGPATRSPIRPAELKLDPPSSPEVQVPSHLRPLAQALAPYGSEIELASANTGVEANWLRAVIIQESGGHSSAVSSQGATGLMQLMPNTATSLGVRDSLNPAENIDGGARYLAAMKRRFGDFRLALAAYNAGPTRVDQYGTIPPYRETQNYVERVMNLKTEFDQVWPPDIKAGNGYESK